MSNIQVPPQAIPLKRERSPAPPLTLQPRASGVKLAAPLPVSCRRTNPNYQKARKLWIQEETKALNALGLSVRNQFVRDDGLSLECVTCAHILECIVELALFFVGMTLGYGRAKTLTGASVRNCLGDLREFKLSIVVGVPAVWETIRKGILTKVYAAGTIKKGLFSGALAVRRANMPGLKQATDAIVFNAVRHQTGGRLRLALSGGAALSRENARIPFIGPCHVGYGMTESCGMCAIMPPEFLQYGPVGAPVPSVNRDQVARCSGIGLSPTNKQPQGEVLIRGPSVIEGYYKCDDLSNDETIFTKDGWLRTGDVGTWNHDDTLSLTDKFVEAITGR